MKLGVDVTLFTVSTNDRDHADAEALAASLSDVIVHKQPLWRSLLNCLSVLPTKTPLQSVFSWNPRLQSDIAGRHRHEKFDLIHVEHLRGSKYGRLARSMFPDLPIIWDSVDSISHLFEQTYSRSRSLTGKLISALELGRTKRAEGELISVFDHILITSQVDKAALMRLAQSDDVEARVSVLPNGVDLGYFRRNTNQPRDQETIVFSGKMSYHANVSMVDYLVREIMPQVWVKHPTVKVVIVGKDPPRKILKVAENPLIEITGTVDDIRPYLWRATIAVVPLVYGAGIQNKILEAMATGTPVVTTSAAISSLRATAGEDALVADSAEAFAATVIRLMENPVLRHRVGCAGLEYVNRYHDWKKMTAELVGIYEQAIIQKREETVGQHTWRQNCV
jgi:glycosyltransferase involved in cell wall biosynthesis